MSRRNRDRDGCIIQRGRIASDALGLSFQWGDNGVLYPSDVPSMIRLRPSGDVLIPSDSDVAAAKMLLVNGRTRVVVQ